MMQVQFFEMNNEIERTDKIYRSRVKTNADNRLNNVVSRYTAHNIKYNTCIVILYYYYIIATDVLGGTETLLYSELLLKLETKRIRSI